MSDTATHPQVFFTAVTASPPEPTFHRSCRRWSPRSFLWCRSTRQFPRTQISFGFRSVSHAFLDSLPLKIQERLSTLQCPTLDISPTFFSPLPDPTGQFCSTLRQLVSKADAKLLQCTIAVGDISASYLHGTTIACFSPHEPTRNPKKFLSVPREIENLDQ
jgi:hypothetical protein